LALHSTYEGLFLHLIARVLAFILLMKDFSFAYHKTFGLHPAYEGLFLRFATGVLAFILLMKDFG